MRTAPQKPPSFSGLTPSAIRDEVDSILTKSKALQDHLATTLTPANATFANLVRPLLDDANKSKCRTVILGILLARSSADAAVRQASRDAQTRISNAEAEALLRPDIAALVSAVFDKSENSAELEDEDRRVLNHLHGQFRRSGATLRDAADRARLQTAQLEVNRINGAAIKGFTETDNGVWFTRSELTGCPETWLATLKMEKQEEEQQHRFWVTCRDDHYSRVLQFATDERTRQKMVLTERERFPENIERISRIVILRDEIARLLGYKNHASLRMEETMVRSVEALQEKLLDLRTKLWPLAKAEEDALLGLKKAELDSRQPSEGISGSNSLKVNAWDRSYYTNIRRKLDFAVDNSKVSEYFEINHVVLEMLRVFEELFGMTFIPMPGMETWHPSVSPWAVWDSAEEGGDFLGYLFLDIFGRDGKFSAQYHSRIQPGFTDAEGRRHYPVSALMCSYPESTPERPSLLQHRDVRILFHELGHAIHHLSERTRYAMGHSRDFGEIPSNMLEHFIWIPEVMMRLSKHYTTLPGYRAGDSKQDSEYTTNKSTIPLSLARAVARTQALNQATGLLGLMQPAVFDLALYTHESHEQAASIDIISAWNKATDKCFPYREPRSEKDRFGPAAFDPLFRGWDVAYFKYVMSRVYAADLYDAGFAGDPLSPKAGRKWRYTVLQLGSSQPELETLHRFLGRSPSSEAIFRQILEGQITH